MIENSSATNSPNGSDRRKESRRTVQVDVLVFCGKDSFRTKTSDISLNGCRLQNPIPLHFSSENLEIILSGGSLGQQSFQMVKGSLVDDSRERLNLKSNFDCSPV